VASLSQGRTAAVQCGLFTHKSVPVIFEPPCIYDITIYFKVQYAKKSANTTVEFTKLKYMLPNTSDGDQNPLLCIVTYYPNAHHSRVCSISPSMPNYQTVWCTGKG